MFTVEVATSGPFHCPPSGSFAQEAPRGLAKRLQKSYFSCKIRRKLRNGKESAVFLSKTHILFEKKEKQLCKAQKILT